ncbi:hypothetical protein [Klebsiella aerogenes]|uniref:hypothetical protein n=1 Tax=Klebsiella aerogenes TaxID=548 RepID=UPI000B2ED7DA|nr:hypothetical protein [Klebsiella aerogenes]
MPDFARKPVYQQAVRQPARKPIGEQAVRLSSFAAKVRFLKFVFGLNWKAVKG